MNIANAKPLLDTVSMPLGERLLYGLQVLVIGIVTVFVVLALLWGVMALFKVFFYNVPNKKKNAAGTANITKVENVPAAEDIPLAASASDDTQLIAVITAAIAAYNASSGNGCLPFRVVSYRRVAGAGGWNGAAEDESI